MTKNSRVKGTPIGESMVYGRSSDLRTGTVNNLGMLDVNATFNNIWHFNLQSASYRVT